MVSLNISAQTNVFFAFYRVCVLEVKMIQFMILCFYQSIIMQTKSIPTV